MAGDALLFLFLHVFLLLQAGSVAGLLDVAKCLSEALAGLHGHQLGHAASGRPAARVSTSSRPDLSP